MPIIHDKTLRGLDEMSRRLFWMNKKIDRMKSIISVKFVMPILGNLIHLELAHKYPLLADEISDIQEMFNFDANYLGVEGATEDYYNMIEVCDTLVRWTCETNDQLNELIKVSAEEGDMNVYWMLGKFSTEYSKYIENALLLQDKANQYGDNYHAFDKDSKEWWKL